MEQMLTGLGLSGSAGLNAYLPLLTIGVMNHLDLIELGEPYTMLSNPAVMAILCVMLMIEMTADKIPAIDNLNDIVNTLIRPTAGAVAFTASTSSVESIDPIALTAISILSGSVAAGAIHFIKAFTRPGVTVTTGGFGNFFVSIIEDVISITVSVFAVLIPFIVVIFAMSVVTLTGWGVWDYYRVKTYFGQDAAGLPTYRKRGLQPPRPPQY